MKYQDNGNRRAWIIGIIALTIIVPLVVASLNSSRQNTLATGGYVSSSSAKPEGTSGTGTSGAGSALAAVSGGSARLPENILKQETSGIYKGTTAPVFTLPSAASSGDISNRDLYGKTTLIDFFSTTCTACIEQTPTLVSFWHSHRSTLNVLGIDEGNSASAVRSFAHKFEAGYLLALDPGAAVAIQYGIVALPTDILISPSGRVITLYVGAVSQGTLLQWLHYTKQLTN
ncbi:MAG: TlpA family protein disulfide reductase [Actinobacteria bacterium]|nr:TlpA family protein disulfide reductase [Actinomycetota bacterium]